MVIIEFRFNRCMDRFAFFQMFRYLGGEAAEVYRQYRDEVLAQEGKVRVTVEIKDGLVIVR